MSSSCRARIAPGLAACTAASATNSRACGVVAASDRASELVGMQGLPDGVIEWSAFDPALGLRNITSLFFAQAKSDLRATSVTRRSRP